MMHLKSMHFSGPKCSETHIQPYVISKKFFGGGYGRELKGNGNGYGSGEGKWTEGDQEEIDERK